MVEAYPVAPDRIRVFRQDVDIIISQPSVAREFRRARNTTGNPRKRFTIFHDHISLADKALILNFFEARRGKWEKFEWTQADAPVGDGVTYTVRFDQDVLVALKPLGLSINPRFSITIKFIEVL